MGRSSPSRSILTRCACSVPPCRWWTTSRGRSLTGTRVSTCRETARWCTSKPATGFARIASCGPIDPETSARSWPRKGSGRSRDCRRITAGSPSRERIRIGRSGSTTSVARSSASSRALRASRSTRCGCRQLVDRSRHRDARVRPAPAADRWVDAADARRDSVRQETRFRVAGWPPRLVFRGVGPGPSDVGANGGRRKTAADGRKRQRAGERVVLTGRPVARL